MQRAWFFWARICINLEPWSHILGGISILIGFLVGITATGFYGMDPKAGLAAAFSGTLGGLISVQKYR